MTSDRRPGTAWLVAVGVLLALTATAVLVLPRSAGAGNSAVASAASVQPRPPSGTPSTGPAPSSTATAPLRLVGFGDSVMAGTGCDCDDFLTRVGAGLHARTGRKVVPDNNGTNGETAAGLLRELTSDDALQAEVAQADVIVLIIGANDLTPALHAWDDSGCGRGCYQPQIDDMAGRLRSILAVVNSQKRSTTPVLVTSYWNVFEDGDIGAGDYGQGYLTWSDAVTRSANTAICAAARLGKATCVDTYAPFKADGSKDPTGLLADDGDHPNDAGTAVITHAVLGAIEQRLG